MEISLNEALELNIFSYFKLLAGKNGLFNRIRKVGILDYETNEIIERNFTHGEFVITTLLVLKDDIEGLKDMVKQLIKVGASGLAIKNVYFEDIPLSVKRLADDMDFPIFIFNTVFFEEIIEEVSRAIRMKEDYEELNIIINNILNTEINPIRARKIVLELNNNFLEKNICAYIESKSERLFEDIKSKFYSIGPLVKNSRLIPYKDGCLLIFTFDREDNSKIKDKVINEINYMLDSHKVYCGIGEIHQSLEEIQNSINEAIYAFQKARIYKSRIVLFEEMGLDKILIPLIDNPWILNYYKENIIPILDYDRKNNTNLMQTACLYIKNQGDIKKTSSELFQHQNTIRYRIEKTRKIIGNNKKITYEELALSIRLYELMERDL